MTENECQENEILMKKKRSPTHSPIQAEAVQCWFHPLYLHHLPGSELSSACCHLPPIP